MLRRMTSTMVNPHKIRTAACMIIGDEVLNGKIKDTNSAYFSRFCFELGIDLRRITVVPDDSEDIAETLNYLRRYDFVVTTGGIGPTHDDITYESIARAYGLPMSEDDETVAKMNEYAKVGPKDRTGSALAAQLRMATFPSGPQVQRIFPIETSWVPVVSLENRVYIFPGIPSIFQSLLEGIRPRIASRIDAPALTRFYVSTKTPESTIAPILSEIHDRYKDSGIKIGSYPHMHMKRNTVSILGPTTTTDILHEIVAEVEARAPGHKISPQEESNSY